MRKSLYLFCFLGYFLSSAIQKYDVRHFNPENGLNGRFVYTTIQGTDGYKWIGTDYGLTRFDGLNFQLIDANDSLQTNFVTAAFPIANGHAYFGYFNGKIKKFNGVDLTIVLDEQELNNPIKGIGEHNGALFAISQNEGFIILGEDSTFTYKPSQLDYQKVNFMSQLDELIFVGTNENLLVFRFDSEGSLVFRGQVDDLAFMASQSLSVNKTRDNSYWVGTDYGLYHLNLEISANAVSGQVYKADFLENKSITAIAEASNLDLWICTKYDGLFRVNFNHDDDQLTFLNKINVLPGHQTSTLYMDSDQSVWVGTIGNGLFQATKKGLLFYSFEEFRARSVNGISGTKAHDLFFATDVGIIKGDYLGESDSLIFSLLPDENSKGNNVSAIYVDDDQQVYYGSEDVGLFVSDLAFENIQKIDLGIIEGKFKPRQIIKDSAGNLWVSLTQKGIIILNPEGRVIKRYSISTQFYHNEIYDIHFDKAGNVWFAAHGAGLAVMRKELMKKDSTIEYLSKDGIFPARNVNDISEDEFGNIWIGTDGNGVFEFNGEDIINFTSREGLLNDYTSSVISDKSNHLWATHRKGLSRIDEFSEALSTIQKKDGLLVAEFIRNSTYRDEDHNIWIGNRNGVTFLSTPDQVFESKMIHPIISDMKIDYESVDLYQYASDREIKGKIPTDIELPYDKNNLTFDFIAINLKNPESNLYQYQLVGLEENWSPIITANQVTFNNLRPGSYTFQVRQSDNPSHWADNISTVSFTVKPPWWNTWWAITLLIISGVAFVYGVIKWRTARLNSRLEEKQRLMAITESQNERIKEFSWITSHQTRSSAASIMGLVTALETDPSNTEFFDMLKKSSNRLNHTISHINELLNFENDRGNLQTESCNVLDVVNELISSNAIEIVAKEAKVQIEIAKDLFVEGSPIYLQNALNQFVTNALTFGITDESKCIEIRASEKESQVEIVIRDHGMGIDLSRYGSKLFKMGSRFHAKVEQGDGIGMYLGKNQIEGMGGSVDLVSEPNVGTTVTILMETAERPELVID